MSHVAFPAALQAQADFNEYTDEGAKRKADLHVKGRTFLRKLVKRLNLDSRDFEVRSNKGGIAVAGEVTLHADSLYLQLSDSAFKPGIRLLFRGCKSRKDYCGLTNFYASADEMSSEEGQNRLVARLKSAMDDGAAHAK